MTQLMTTASDVRMFLLNRYEAEMQKKGIDADSLPDDFDLLNEGIIDSLGILDVVVAIDGHFSINVDFENMDAGSLTQIGPLSRYVEDKIREARE